jgi:hypothetical protein
MADGELSPENEIVSEEETPNLPARLPEVPLPSREIIGGMLRPVAKPEEILEAQEQTRVFIAKALKEGRDYGTIPSTTKPSLYKPGAERTSLAFGCHARFSILEREVEHDRLNQYVKREWEWHPSERGKKVWTETPGESHGLYRYVMLCELVHRASGFIVGSGVGSCSTMESKYIDRPRDLENTVLKMGKKRSFIDAVLTTFGLSEQFTQDTEDMPREHFQNGQDGQAAFSLDSPAAGKDNQGKTWGETCRDNPDFVMWAIGRKSNNPDGMSKLSQDQKDLLGAELDRLAGDPSPESETPEKDDLLSEILGFGKHKDLTWNQILEQDSGYIQTVFDRPWGRKRVPPGSPLHDALRLALETRQDVQEDADPEAPPHMTAGVAFTKACTDYSITNTEWETFARVHRDFPDDVDSWTEEDYERIMGIFQRKGVRAAIDRAMRAAQPKGEGIPDGKISEARRLVIRCRESEIPYYEDHSRNVEAAIKGGNEVMLDDAVTRVQQAILDDAAKHGKPGAGQTKMEV